MQGRPISFIARDFFANFVLLSPILSGCVISETLIPEFGIGVHIAKGTQEAFQ